MHNREERRDEWVLLEWERQIAYDRSGVCQRDIKRPLPRGSQINVIDLAAKLIEKKLEKEPAK